MRVTLFITCFNDTLFPSVGIATTQVLERLGQTVDFPEVQTCCGQMCCNRLCCKKMERKGEGMVSPLLLSLDCHSE